MRRPLHILSGLSLLLCLALAALGVRSFFQADRVGWSQEGVGDIYLRTGRGGVGLFLNARRDRMPAWPGFTYYPKDGPLDYPFAWGPDGRPHSGWNGIFPRSLGFQYLHEDSPSESDVSVVFPLALTLLLTALLPARWLLVRRGNRRIANEGNKHPCPSCGYDLRATPERCPECGNALHV